MKRTTITLEAIAERKNLLLAFNKAAKGKRYRRDVCAFMLDFDANLNALGEDIRKAHLPYGRYREFLVFDPKKRLIHAACFEDRVFHHALMNLAGGRLERSMVNESYACSLGKGIHKAVERVQRNLQAHSWYGQIDIDAYFASIPHESLLALLMCRFKGGAVKAQFQRILASHEREPGKGLPIGSLTSQYFANFYLDGLDRLLSEHPLVNANVRYMDDIIWWCDSREDVHIILEMVREWLNRERGLTIKTNLQIQASKQGTTFCGSRILPGTVRLSRRRKKRYQQRRHYWEQKYLAGEIDAQQLQQAQSSVHAITHGTDSLHWRSENLRRHPPIDV